VRQPNLSQFELNSTNTSKDPGTAQKSSTLPSMTASKSKAALGEPPSPSASFYDMSDDEEGDYNTIAHSRSGKGVKLLFSKSKV
jgi:hypothetical protein